MLYHFGTWIDVSHPLSRLGIYGVSLFFVISGLSIAIAYNHFIVDTKTVIIFYLRRLFRIWPLLWIAVGLVVIPTFITGINPWGGGEPFAFTRILLNLTTLAGLISDNNGGGWINVGAWSLGVEMVFYLVAPLIIASYRYAQSIGNAISVISLVPFVIYCFVLLNPDQSLAYQFSTYASPANNLIFFWAGIAIYYNAHNFKFPSCNRRFYFWTPLLIFFLYPVSGDQINIVTGVSRIIFSICCVWIVFVWWKCPPTVGLRTTFLLSRLGAWSYGIYLLHPIVAWYVVSVFSVGEEFFQVDKIPYVRTILSLILTIAMASIVYRSIEKPFINFGRRFNLKAG